MTRHRAPPEATRAGLDAPRDGRAAADGNDAESVLDARLAPQLAALRERSLYRVRRQVDGAHAVQMTVDGQPLVSFCSNDYLGLAGDPRVAEAARTALARSGTGSTGSALISGHNHEHRALEDELADYLGRPRALLFSTGWASNVGVLKALLGRDDVVVADELNHASLIDGARASGAQYRRVAHGDLRGFEHELLEASASRDGLTAVVTDGVFSMDGDVADLPALSRLCRRHRAALIVDDAHGLGVLGGNGRGLVEHFEDLARDSASTCPGDSAVPDVHLATLGKSLGCAGGVVAGSETLIEYLVQRARTFVFSTAPPPAIAAAARAALRIVRREPEHRQRLHANLARFVAGARERGLPIAGREPPTPIQPLPVGDDARVLALSRELMARGYWVAGIRPPTVPRGTARLRITLSAAHTPAQIDGLLDALHESLAALPVP